MPTLRDLTGQTFNRLTVLHRAKSVKKESMWTCRCSCGAVVTVYAKNLWYKRTQSCGCFNEEGNVKANLSHGHSSGSHVTAEYEAWRGIKARCSNPRRRDWKNYGGRGIKVCKRWKKFENFLADMGPKPHPSLTIERVNNNGNYEPSNCKWATYFEQVHNRRALTSRTGTRRGKPGEESRYPVPRP